MNTTSKNISIPEPRLSRVLFAETGPIAWVWLVLRLYVGYEWLTAGWEKFTGGWVGEKAGTAIQGFFQGVLAQTTGAHPNVSSWYAFFIQNVAVAHPALISYVVTYGEILVGLGLILGAFTGIAAFFGAFMNFNYLFAGAVSINPLLLLIELFLILAWRNAGWLGLDRWLLPAIGVPWQPGKAMTREIFGNK